MWYDVILVAFICVWVHTCPSYHSYMLYRPYHFSVFCLSSSSSKTYSLLETQRALLEERKTLSKEVEFLQNQLKDEQKRTGLDEQLQQFRSQENRPFEYIPTKDTTQGISEYEEG